MPKKHQISYVKPAEPKFIRQLKDRTGFVEGPNVETKREKLPSASHDSSDSDDEKPIVVALKPGDLTQEEADKIIPKSKPVRSKNESEESNKKMTFSKPSKRVNENPLNSSSSVNKKHKSRELGEKTDRQGVKNTSLLSFGNEEEDDI